MQVASAQAELSQKVLLVPAAPSSLNASLSLGAIGIMVGCPLLALCPPKPESFHHHCPAGCHNACLHHLHLCFPLQVPVFAYLHPSCAGQLSQGQFPLLTGRVQQAVVMIV